MVSRLESRGSDGPIPRLRSWKEPGWWWSLESASPTLEACRDTILAGPIYWYGLVRGPSALMGVHTGLATILFVPAYEVVGEGLTHGVGGRVSVCG